MKKIGNLLKTLLIIVAITSAIPSQAADFWQLAFNIPIVTTTSTSPGYYHRNAGILQHHAAHHGYRVGRPIVQYHDDITPYGYRSHETDVSYRRHGRGRVVPSFTFIIGGH